jgi:drug/metabolite transporter (DMT)-like permease
VLGLAAAFLYAGYVVASSRVVGTAGPLASSTVVLASAAVSYGLLVLVRGPVLPGTPEGWAALVGLTLVSTVMATLTFFAGLERVGPVTASLLSAVEPVVAVLLGAAFLGERLSLLQGVGGLLILVAVGLLARADSTRA